MGRLKRIRGTPTPVSAYVSARLLFAVGLGLFTSLLCVAVGVLFFGVGVSPPNLLAFLLCHPGRVGEPRRTGAGHRRGDSRTRRRRRRSSTPRAFPILFLSSVFYPIERPAGLAQRAHPRSCRSGRWRTPAIGAFFGAGPEIADLAIVLAWGVLGAVIAARFFRWQPNR